MGPFITFEGIEGCGKTTQLRMAADYHRQLQIPLITSEEPGGTPMGRKIREMLLNTGTFPIGAEAELLLFSAARAQHIREVILPAVKDGTWVLCDRFTDATLAYQGYGRGIDLQFIHTVNDFSCQGLKPDMTILIDLPEEMGLQRARDRMAGLERSIAEDRFEQEAFTFHKKVREGYLTLAEQDPRRFRLIDGSRDVISVHREVCAHLSFFLNR